MRSCPVFRSEKLENIESAPPGLGAETILTEEKHTRRTKYVIALPAVTLSVFS